MILGANDTIAALATSKGISALSIVRISGPRAKEILEKCFVTKQKIESQRVHYGFWKNERNEQIDQVTVLYFGKGTGFTGETAAEIIGHGNPVITEMILQSILAAGARVANPGEFTYRAVMNDKLDLVQAENILEIIHAKTPLRAKQALNNIKGYFSTALEEIDNELIFVLAHMEASIDFTTEDIQPVDLTKIQTRVEAVAKRIEGLISSFERGEKIQQGLRVAIVGKPNAGKSSLLNALLGKDRSIVTPVAGTTRDTVEAQVYYDDCLVTFIDTAGLRETVDEVEVLGIKKTRDEISTADLVLYVVDCTAIQSENELFNEVSSFQKNKTIICLNKKDLVNDFSLGHSFSKEMIRVSCLEHSGIDEVHSIIKKLAVFDLDSETEPMAVTKRQKEGLLLAKTNVTCAVDLLKQVSSPEFAAFELKEAVIHVRMLLGKEVRDDIMDKVFKEFCIGK